jgi:hypothetical protein
MRMNFIPVVTILKLEGIIFNFASCCTYSVQLAHSSAKVQDATSLSPLLVYRLSVLEGV